MPSLKRKILGKPKIVHKGLAIVFLPLAVNLGLVFVLDGSLDRATQWMERTRQNSVVIIGLAQCLFTTTGIMTVGTNAMMNGSYTLLGGLVEDLLGQLDLRLNALEPHAKLDRAFPQMHKELNALIAHQRAIFLKSEAPELAQDDLPVQILRAKNWTKTAALQSALLQQALRRCEIQFRRTAEQEIEAQRRTEAIVAGGLLINLLLALALAYFFNKNISGRVNILIRNARKIPLYEPIREKVGGYDELTEVGDALRTASREVRAAAEYRRTLMQMMSHDLRSPLSAGKISIEILERYTNTVTTPEDQEDIQNIMQGLDNCLDLISDLLLLERLEAGHTELNLELENMRELVETATQTLAKQTKTEGVQFTNATAQQYLELDREQMLLVLKKLLTIALDQLLPGSASKLVGRINIAGSASASALKIEITTSPVLLPAALNVLGTYLYDHKLVSPEAGQLSIAICKQILTAHGGEMGIDLESGAIWFRLPSKEEAASA